MKDAIYRQAAIDEIKALYEWHEIVTEDRAIDHFKRLPSTQPEIVRCKECKWSYDDVSGRICSYGVCVDCVVGDDFYCADAERRTDG